MKPAPELSEVRTAVRRFVARHVTGDRLAVACSGGPDSLALAAAVVHCTGGHRTVHGLVVDHGLQPGSAAVAAATAATLRELGCTETGVLRASVDGGSGNGGLEAAARRARYALLRDAAPTGALILLGHTRDDQAETVLLGLGRGSGPRSIAGMRPVDPPWGRPLLDLPRTSTRGACAALGLRPWDDPHNVDPRFRRTRLRHEVLPLLEDVLAGGVGAALARTARQLQDDLDALDELATRVLATLDDTVELCVAELAAHPAAVRRRVLRHWLLARGVRELTDHQLRSADELIGEWRGQGGVRLPGNFVLDRAHGRLRLLQPSASERP